MCPAGVMMGFERDAAGSDSSEKSARTDKRTAHYVHSLESDKKAGMCKIGLHPYSHIVYGPGPTCAALDLRLVLFPASSSFSMVRQVQNMYDDERHISDDSWPIRRQCSVPAYTRPPFKESHLAPHQSVPYHKISDLALRSVFSTQNCSPKQVQHGQLLESQRSLHPDQQTCIMTHHVQQFPGLNFNPIQVMWDRLKPYHADQ